MSTISTASAASATARWTFDDLLLQTNILLRDAPDVLARYQELFKYILVDEYQDTNYAQYVIIRRLSQLHSRVCVVGDDAQSIYSFRGAKIENILSFQKDFPAARVFKLVVEVHRAVALAALAVDIVDIAELGDLRLPVFGGIDRVG